MIKLIRHCHLAEMSPCVATIGNFDGLHLGHFQLIEKMLKRAQALSLLPTVITFEPLPQTLLRPEIQLLRLLSFRQKLRLLENWGIKQVVCLRFNQKLARLSPLAFIEEYLINRINMRYLMVGEDFRFGHRQEGNIETLYQASTRFNFGIEPISLLQAKELKVSSTQIRRSLLEGELKTASALLGRHYSIIGRVIKGDQRGRTLGFPTANLAVKADNLIKGVFASWVQVGEEVYQGVTNVGTRPTVDGKKRLIEVHLLDYAGDLYGKRIAVEFLHKLRDEKRFENIEALKQQIAQDILQAKEWLAVSVAV
ncbi:MAG: bifunctional riboflavin kinase/FAD synthetase [Gammaproteobacteria bacterium]|nr:bifunctional riboflavin kinase/FAD synthetase [Gammaproteobacteria bacterium]